MKAGICTGYPGLKFDRNIHSIEQYVEAEQCFIPNSHCTISGTHSTMCIKAQQGKLFAGNELHDGRLDCSDRE